MRPVAKRHQGLKGNSLSLACLETALLVSEILRLTRSASVPANTGMATLCIVVCPFLLVTREGRQSSAQ